MSPPTIQDGNVRLEVTLIHPPAATVGTSPSPGAGFLAWWKDEAHRRHLRPPRMTGADHRLAAILINRHGMGQLKALAVGHFRRHAFMQEVSVPEMVAFAARIPVIEEELRQQATGEET